MHLNTHGNTLIRRNGTVDGLDVKKCFGIKSALLQLNNCFEVTDSKID